MEHRLIDDTLVTEDDGIAARCVCGWSSTGHFSSMAASVAFQDHVERETHTLGDAPIEDKYRAQMNALASSLDEIFNGVGVTGDDRKTGFVLLVFPFNDKGRCNFISNGADRRDIVTLFKEMIRRFEGQPEVTGRA